MKYGWVLVELQKKINRIEDNVVDYQQNKKWIKYRNQQERIYNEFRKENGMEMQYEEKERNCMASSNHDSICRSNTFGNSMEVVVLDRARFLLLEPTQRTKEDCVNQAIRELAEKYIENTAGIFDILIEEAREDFKQTILKQL